MYHSSNQIKIMKESACHTITSLIFILTLKTRPLKKKRKKNELGGGGCEEDFSGFTN